MIDFCGVIGFEIGKRDREAGTLGYTKYDHFFVKKWYGCANAGGKQDEFKDVDLRVFLGIGSVPR